MTVFHRLKSRLLLVAQKQGLFRLLAHSRWRSRRLLILCFHGVSTHDEHQWSPELYVAPSTLNGRLELLRKRRYNVLPLSEALHRLYAQTLPEKSVALTFDDGAYDFYAEAYPILREFGFPATLYLTTFYCAYQRPVFETISSYLLWKGQGRAVDATGLVAEPGEIRIPSARPDVRAELHARVLTFARERHLSAEAKDDVARVLAQRLGEDYGDICRRRFLHIINADELRALDPKLVSVQLHTHRHRTPDNEILFAREIQDNRRFISSLLPQPPTLVHFCYPSGRYLRSFLPWLRDLSIVSATTCDPGLADSAADPLLLPRFVDSNENSQANFEAWTSGFWPWIRGHRLSIGMNGGGHVA